MTRHPPGHAPDGPPVPDYPPTPGYPRSGSPTPDHPPTPGSPTPGYPPWDALPGSLPEVGTADEERPPGEPAVAHDEYARPVTACDDAHCDSPAHDGPEYGALSAGGSGARPRLRPAVGAGSAADARRAVLAYLTVPFFGFLPALVIYLLALRTSPWVRSHAAQAVNVWITGFLYDLSGSIMGAMLALDTPGVAVLVVMPAAVILWLITLAHLVRAAEAASRGEDYSFPRWLCTPMAR